MYKCIANRDFVDKHTGNLIVAGASLELSEERIKEIKDVDKTLICVLGEIVEKTEHRVVVDFTPNEVVEPIEEEPIEEEPIEESDAEDVKSQTKKRTRRTTK